MTIWNCIGVLRKKVIFLLGRWFVNSPFLFGFYAKRHSVRNRIVSEKSDICVEGFQRSGNSYLFMCLSVSNPNLLVAHHIHGIAHIKLAIKLGIPCIVLVRDPASSIASLLTWDSRLGVNIALNSYMKYYASLLKLPKSVFFVNFDDLIIDVNGVINDFNKRYELALSELNLSSEELKSIMKERQNKYTNLASAPFPSRIKNISNIKNKELVLAHNDFYKAQNYFNSILERVSY